MNQTQALDKLRKILGPKIGYRIDKAAPTAGERDEIRATWLEAKRISEEAEAARVARMNELLQADELYQKLKAKAKDAAQARDSAVSKLHSHRITVGITSNLFFSVKAQGDNWEEVVAKATGDAA